jgi:superfamily II DNA/RNA helicase
VRSGQADLSAVEITVLDEADHMADLGFLPPVKRLLDKTPRGGQRLLFSATLDRGVDVLVKRYLHDPVEHSVDSAQSPVAAMEHHVLHIDKAARIDVLADLVASPGRTIVFSRTKHGAKALTRQLNSRGVASVELHGNLSQNARTRNLAAFSDGTASVLVATDIAARGIHVDEVGLVVHADPPVEHKAYLHRSGRTARAGAEGTVVTLMLDTQVSDVRTLTRKAGVKPTITRFSGSSHPVLRQIAPGERTFGRPVTAVRPEPSQPQQVGRRGKQRRRRGARAA